MQQQALLERKDSATIPVIGLVPWLMIYYAVRAVFHSSPKEKELRTKFRNHYPLMILEGNCSDWRATFLQWCKIPSGVAARRILNIGNMTSLAWPVLNSLILRFVTMAWNMAHSYDFSLFDGRTHITHPDDPERGIPVAYLCGYHTDCAGFKGNTTKAFFEQLMLSQQLNKVFGRMKFRGKRFFYPLIIGQDVATHSITMHAPDGTSLSTDELILLSQKARMAQLDTFVEKFVDAHVVIQLFIKRLFTGNIPEVSMVKKFGLPPAKLEHVERFLLYGNTFEIMEHPALRVNPVDPQVIRRTMTGIGIGRKSILAGRIPSDEFVFQINEGLDDRAIFNDRQNAFMKVHFDDEFITGPIVRGCKKYPEMLDTLHFLKTVTNQETWEVTALEWYQLRSDGTRYHHHLVQ